MGEKPTMALRGLAFGIAVSALGLSSCTAPGGPDREIWPDPIQGGPGSLGGADGGAGTSGDGPVIVSALCVPNPAGERMHGRVVGGPTETTIRTNERTIFVTDLFRKFKGLCGACHVDNSIGNVRVDISNFANIDLGKFLAVMKSDDPAKFMPPPVAQGKPWSKRQPDDPVVELANELVSWFAQKAPPDKFTIKTEETVTQDSYAVSEELAESQSNIGTCIPEPGAVATENEEMDELDAFFAQATELPEKLSQTDLTSFDSAVLARKGVVAFAPAYPLWSEDSGKLRFIRVPRGTSVYLHQETQNFVIPRNTRFYKTFLKKIVDANGQTVWRKIETRLIVTRPDKEEAGTPAQPQALFGAYAWNDDETEAVLVRDPLRSGEPFGDRMFTYVVDQPRYQKVVDSLGKNGNLNYELDQEKNKGVVRHYVIPGKQRCIECHMGSQSRDFVLGFTPLQVRRRPKGLAGTYEDVGADELSQLQRLMDYKIISRAYSPSDFRGLEESQGTRKYRNAYELTAQAYLLANCAFCHNPRGFPSVNAPELRDVLNFWPGASGGIFQFPLDRMSPLRRRGAKQDIDIPYVTPSLRDYPAVTTTSGIQRDIDLWKPKWINCSAGATHPTYGAFCDLTFNPGTIKFISAPWRSLIYRNIDTPYIYADDYTVFPHMPRHSAGFDCRAPRIVAEWMISIPALHKKQFAEQEHNVLDTQGMLDTHAQPYEEVKPGDSNYARALEAAAERLHEYRTGARYSYCPDRRDIVVREALTTTDPKKLTPPDRDQLTEGTPKRAIMPEDMVPDRAHLVPSDLTEAPGDWAPRRGDWQDHLVKTKKPEGDVVDVPTILKDVRITPQMREYALREIPFGLWRQKPGCDFSSIKKVKDYTGDDRPKWMDHPMSMPMPDAPVYSITAGGAIFNNICVNCHGPQADSKGVLAEAISEMTGGDARVANFKGGLLGPANNVGANIERVFGPTARMSAGSDMPLTAEDWAARYLAWMALGGTQRSLPPSLLAIVGATQVMGLARGSRGVVFEGSANMLSLARTMCGLVLSPVQNEFVFGDTFGKGGVPWVENTTLLDKTGDAEMWQRVCSVGNRPVVRVLRFINDAWRLDFWKSFYWGEVYGENPVMNHRGEVQNGIKWDNLLPLCVAAVDLEQSKAKRPMVGETAVPTCPAPLLEERTDPLTRTAGFRWGLRVITQGQGQPPSLIGRDEWAVRGAANAGIAVLVYLQDVRRGKIVPKPQFDRCEQIKK